VRISAARKKLRPGDLAPITGVYLATHGVRHRDQHEVVIIRGEQLPSCRTCKQSVFFEVIRPVSHITHDWDFSGPFNLAVKRPGSDAQDFRIFQRAQIQLPIKVQLGDPTATEVIQGITNDLSAGGLGAVIRSGFHGRYREETVKITIGNGRELLSVEARLRYQNGLRYGFQFINVNTAEREAIRRIITKRKTRPATVAT
jgi:hypothetical protein